MNWVVVSKGKGGNRFYPIHLIGKKLKAAKLTYDEASKKPEKYWDDKYVVFHGVWAKKHPWNWLPIYKDIAKQAKVFWLEFDADHHLNSLLTMEQASWGKPFFIWEEFEQHVDNYIWEVPMGYNPFIRNVNRLKFKMYDKNFEQPIPQDKDIDVVGFVDTANRNVVYTMRLLDKLHKDGYKVKALMAGKKYYDLYKDVVDFEIVKNSMFSDESEKVFHDLMKRSKFLLDISDRITLGRNAYEALLIGGTLPVLNSGYGFPSLNKYNKNLSMFYSNLSYWIKNYRQDTVIHERKWFAKHMSIDSFIEELKSESKRLTQGK